jgi:hypothetical protein
LGAVIHQSIRPSIIPNMKYKAYCDATWASDPSDRRSLSVYCVFLFPHYLKTKKQVTVSHSSAEVELRAMTLVTADVT